MNKQKEREREIYIYVYIHLHVEYTYIYELYGIPISELLRKGSRAWARGSNPTSQGLLGPVIGHEGGLVRSLGAPKLGGEVQG